LIIGPTVGAIPYTVKGEIFLLNPVIEDANAMSEDLEKGVNFELVLIRNIHQVLKQHESIPDSDEEEEKLTMVKAIYFKEEMEFLWPKDKFLERYESMKSVYVQIQEDGIGNIRVLKFAASS